MWALKTKENKSINISWVIKVKSRILPLPGLCRPQHSSGTQTFLNAGETLIHIK